MAKTPPTTAPANVAQRANKPAAPKAPVIRRVQATRMGLYQHARRRIGDVFVLVRPEDFRPSWMIPVEDERPTRTTGPQAALNKQHDEILGGTVNRPKSETATNGPRQRAVDRGPALGPEHTGDGEGDGAADDDVTK